MDAIIEYYLKQAREWDKIAFDIACKQGGVERYAYAMQRSRDFNKLAEDSKPQSELDRLLKPRETNWQYKPKEMSK